MGGAKRKGIAQAEKTQQIREEKKKGKKKEKTGVEKKTQVGGLPKIDDKSLTAELKKMKAITPTTVSSAYSVRISAAKDFLEELERQGLVTFVEGCKRLRIYKPAVAETAKAPTPAS